MSDNNNLYISIGDPKYSCKLINQPLIRLQGRSSYSFSYSDTFKTGVYDNCRSSGIFYGNNITYLHNSQQDHHQHTKIKHVPEKKIEVKDLINSESEDDLVRLPVPDVDSVNPFLIELVQRICVNNNNNNDRKEHHPRTLIILNQDDDEDEGDKLINITKFSDASYDFYRHKWCADLPNVLTEHPIHPDHLLNLFTPTNDDDDVYTCKGCNFPVNGFGFKCTADDYNLCLRCASLPHSILHEAHKHPLVLTSSSKEVIKCAACCSDVYGATFTCVDDECGYAIHGTCALLPRSVKHSYDKLHPFVLRYPTTKITAYDHEDEEEDPSSRPFCEICEKDVNVKGNEGWLYHCPDCDMFGCIECFAMHGS